MTTSIPHCDPQRDARSTFQTHISMPSTNNVNRAFGAGIWTIGTRLGTKLVDLILLLCLARFLGPEEFGLVAIAMTVIFIVEALFELPVGAALMSAGTLTPSMLSTAFTLNLIRGILITVLLIALSVPLAMINDDQRLSSLLMVLALAPVARGLSSPGMIEYSRNFDFRRDAFVEIVGKVVAIVISVTVAVATGSYWAIAIATVCSPLVSSLLSYLVAPVRLSLTVADWKLFSNLIGWNFLSQVCSALNWQIDRLLLPRLITTKAFGEYALGKQIAEIPIQALIVPTVRPAMAALASAPETRASTYVELSKAISFLAVPVFMIAIVWADNIIKIGLGEGWLPAAVWLQAVSVIALISLPGSLLAPLAMTMGHTRAIFWRTLIELIIKIPLIWIMASRYGVLGAVIASALATGVATVGSLFIVRSLIGASVIHQVMTLGRPLVAVLVPALMLWWSKTLLLEMPNMLYMILCSAVVLIAYMALYALSICTIWYASGKPVGIEKSLIEACRSLIMKALRPRRDARSFGSRTNLNDH